MTILQSSDSHRGASRRDFLKSTSTSAIGAAVGAAVASGLTVPRLAHADGDGGDTLKVGLVGCGGRGAGAVNNALTADGNSRLVALAEIFDDRLQECRQRLAKYGERYTVSDDMCFSGFDAYKDLLATDVDVVILATPPHFRPAHLRACVEAGKHIFTEKPMAVDAPGVRSVIDSSELARQKGLSLVSGFCYRYEAGVRETIRRIKEEGAIGDIVAIQADSLRGTLWYRGDDPSWSEMERQIRNWYYYTWLSGDHDVEQHVHSIDKAAWLLDDRHPVRAVGMGGRQQRTEKKFGNIYDHHAVVFEFDDGVRVYGFCRQQDGCSGGLQGTDEYVLGTKGQALLNKYRIFGENKWRFREEVPNRYVVEHEVLFESIRTGKPVNDGSFMANSTMMAIMGRMCSYTGQTLTWDQCLNSNERLGPEKYEWGDVPEPVIAIPGLTDFA